MLSAAKENNYKQLGFMSMMNIIMMSRKEYCLNCILNIEL